MSSVASPLLAFLFGRSELVPTKRRFKAAIRDIVRGQHDEALDEAAFPAYAHQNPLVDFLVWRKWMLAHALALRCGPGRALDFGCGPGMSSYALANCGFDVLALDRTLAPLRLLQRSLPFPAGIRYFEGPLAQAAIADGSLDLVLALDVLEHVDDLEDCVARFHRFLGREGALVVSVPTENRVYALGRRVAGPRFTGDYHRRGLREVRAAVSARFVITQRYRLIWPCTLFEVFRARRGP